MMRCVTKIDFSDFTEAVPAFFTIAMMPFTYSIANGIAAGMIFYPVMKLATGKRSEEHTSELQSRQYLVCRLLLEKKKNIKLDFNTKQVFAHLLTSLIRSIILIDIHSVGNASRDLFVMLTWRATPPLQ